MLSTEQKRFLFKDQLLIPAAINFFANGAIAWLIVRGQQALSYWGDVPIGPDILLTSFLLPFLMCLINSAILMKKQAVIDFYEAAPVVASFTWMAMRPIWMRSVILAVICAMFYGVGTVLLLPLVIAEPISTWTFVTFKAVWAAALAAIISPFIAIWALAKI